MEDDFVKKRITKGLILAMLAAGLIRNINLVSADEGRWVQTENKWWYENTDGSYIANEWMKENQDWYYFNSDGYIITDWAQINGDWYYFDQSGKMKTGWLSLADDWYYLKENGIMQSGWSEINGKWYYLDETGKMREGWQEDFNGSRYYFGADGALKIGWFEDNNKWYYGQTNGVIQIGWLKDGQDWYYFKEDGSMAADTWIEDCYVNASGVWSQVAQSDDHGLTVEAVDWTQEQVLEKINELRMKFPEGMYWNHMGLDPYLANTSEIVTGIPCDHDLHHMAYCNNYVLGNVRGYQCDGFARKMSDLIFSPEAPIIDYKYDFEKIKVGDYLRYNDIHTVFVIGKGADYIDTVEVNYGGTCMIHWDGKLSKTTLDKLSIETFTRY